MANSIGLIGVRWSPIGVRRSPMGVRRSPMESDRTKGGRVKYCIRLSMSASQSSLPPGDFQSSADPSPSVDDTPLAAEEDLLAPIASGGMPAGTKVDCLQHKEDDYSKLGEDIQREDSDFERRVLTRAIQLGLDSNSEAVHELLSH